MSDDELEAYLRKHTLNGGTRGMGCARTCHCTGVNLCMVENTGYVGDIVQGGKL